MLTDAHAHLDYFNEKELKQLIGNAKKNNVKYILTNSTDLDSSKKSLEIKKKYQNIVKLAVGLYPDDKLTERDFKEFEKFVLENKKEIIAIGEIGMDFKEGDNKESQELIFRKQLELAEKLNVPAIIHSRKAEKEIIKILKNYPNLKKVMHCFCGKYKLAQEALNLGCYFSIPTNIVRSQQFQEIVKTFPKEKIITETDSPFLSPHKDKKNEPSFIKESIKKISEIWRISEDKTEKQIEQNFHECFGPIS